MVLCQVQSDIGSQIGLGTQLQFVGCKLLQGKTQLKWKCPVLADAPSGQVKVTQLDAAVTGLVGKSQGRVAQLNRLDIDRQRLAPIGRRCRLGFCRCLSSLRSGCQGLSICSPVVVLGRLHQLQLQAVDQNAVHLQLPAQQSWNAD